MRLQTKGRFEASIKMPQANATGAWPAWWCVPVHGVGQLSSRNTPPSPTRLLPEGECWPISGARSSCAQAARGAPLVTHAAPSQARLILSSGTQDKATTSTAGPATPRRCRAATTMAIAVAATCTTIRTTPCGGRPVTGRPITLLSTSPRCAGARAKCVPEPSDGMQPPRIRE